MKAIGLYHMLSGEYSSRSYDEHYLIEIEYNPVVTRMNVLYYG